MTSDWRPIAEDNDDDEDDDDSQPWEEVWEVKLLTSDCAIEPPCPELSVGPTIPGFLDALASLEPTQVARSLGRWVIVSNSEQ